MSGALLLESGRLAIYDRNGVFYARIRLKDGGYFYRSLYTHDRATAIRDGRRLLFSVDEKREIGAPLHERSFSSVIDEYCDLRARQVVQGHTTFHMYRQVQRVSKFWHEYIGDQVISAIGDMELRGFVQWRRDYYSRKGHLPKNASLHPADKTLQWEIMLGKAILKYAHEQGYRGRLPLPTFAFTPKNVRVRPAFEVSEYLRLLRALEQRRLRTQNARWQESRLALRDYVIILANCGMRVGEANNLKIRDVLAFTDEQGRRNYRLIVKGKTGQRDVICRASIAKRIRALLDCRSGADPDDWLFTTSEGSRISTLADQFNITLALAGLTHSRYGEKYSLYSLRHFYAVMALRRGIGVFEIARNMGTSVQIIQAYYGKHATPMMMATQLGR